MKEFLVAAFAAFLELKVTLSKPTVATSQSHPWGVTPFNEEGTPAVACDTNVPTGVKVSLSSVVVDASAVFRFAIFLLMSANPKPQELIVSLTSFGLSGSLQ